MSTVKEFGDTATALSRNPLGIIALFIVLIYGFASIVVGASGNLKDEERYLIVIFMTIFPVIVLGVFSWLVACHHEKLYAPKDFSSDDGFHKSLSRREKGRSAISQLDGEIESKIKEVLESDEIQNKLAGNPELKNSISKAADKITSEIRHSYFITIDATQFTGRDVDVFELPEAAFLSLDELTDEIYFLIADYVKPYVYGHDWVLRRQDDNSIIKNARMITNTKPGIPITDERSLKEVGIHAGMVIEVIKP